MNFNITEAFFQRNNTQKVAKDLLGKVLVRKHRNGRIQAGIIVEVESYHGFDDKASHASKSKTKRNEVMFGKGGHYYVYLIYGMYWNLNIVTGDKDFPSAILIRALEPIFDSEINLNKLSKTEKFKLSSGPGKLCRWMDIDKSFYGKSVEDEELFLVDPSRSTQEPPSCHPEEQTGKDLRREDLDLSTVLKIIRKRVDGFNIVESKRIGVDYAEEWAQKNWRYYIKDNIFVSRK